MNQHDAERALQWSQSYTDEHYPELKMRWATISGDFWAIGYTRPTPNGDKSATYTINRPVTQRYTEEAVKGQVESIIKRSKSVNYLEQMRKRPGVERFVVELHDLERGKTMSITDSSLANLVQINPVSKKSPLEIIVREMDSQIKAGSKQ